MRLHQGKVSFQLSYQRESTAILETIFFSTLLKLVKGIVQGFLSKPENSRGRREKLAEKELGHMGPGLLWEVTILTC